MVKSSDIREELRSEVQLLQVERSPSFFMTSGQDASWMPLIFLTMMSIWKEAVGQTSDMLEKLSLTGVEFPGAGGGGQDYLDLFAPAGARAA